MTRGGVDPACSTCAREAPAGGLGESFLGPPFLTWVQPLSWPPQERTEVLDSHPSSLLAEMFTEVALGR